MSKIARYFATVRYLKPKQIQEQVKKRILPTPQIPMWEDAKEHTGILLEGIEINALDNCKEFQQRFKPSEILNGSITLIHKTVPFDGTIWNYQECTPLWNFNLHYFEYGIALASAYQSSKDVHYVDRFINLYNSWMEHPVEASWHPYTISLRLRNLLIAQTMFSDALPKEFANKLDSSVHQQYQYLQKNTEMHLLGNHYFENLATIVVCSLVFGEGGAYDRWFPIFLKEIKEQVLGDGVHFERSLMYHKLILEDIIRVTSLLKARRMENYKELLPTIQKMLDAMVSLEKGCDRTPLFNDCGDNVAKPAIALTATCDQLFGMKPTIQDDFKIAGYYKLYTAVMAVFVDAGSIGPDYIPGHAQCDALSFELFYRGEPVFVNSGTGKYQGECRKWYRSTAAHNTVQINDHEQSDCWGEHRVGKRLHNIEANRISDGLKCKCINQFGEEHKRLYKIVENGMTVIDTVPLIDAQVESFLHVAPNLIVQPQDDELHILNNGKRICTITVKNGTTEIATSLYAEDFEEQKEATQIRILRQSQKDEFGYTIKFYDEKE